MVGVGGWWGGGGGWWGGEEGSELLVLPLMNISVLFVLVLNFPSQQLRS